MIKERTNQCPKCGEEVMITCEDYNCDMNSAVWYFRCDKCDAEWEEYFDSIYVGYKCDRKYYDEKGVCTHDYSKAEN